jgi:RNA polymerase sigma-70 factor (ECF subfamily)
MSGNIGITPHRQATDEQLVLAALVGGIPAFDELVRRYRAAVIHVAEQVIGSRAAAEDVAQEVFLLAFKALQSLDEPAKFAGWLRAIARHRAHRVATREWRSQATEQSKLDTLIVSHSRELSRTSDPVEEFERREEQDAVWQAMESLPSEYREALFLRGHEDWPVEQIAAFLSLTEATVRGRLFRAREALRQRLHDMQNPKTSTARAKGKGIRRNERQRNEPDVRNPAHPQHAAADVSHGRARQYDRRVECGCA